MELLEKVIGFLEMFLSEAWIIRAVQVCDRVVRGSA